MDLAEARIILTKMKPKHLTYLRQLQAGVYPLTTKTDLDHLDHLDLVKVQQGRPALTAWGETFLKMVSPTPDPDEPDAA